MPQHCDSDVLTLLALGESVGSSDDVTHLASCSHCQSEPDQLRAIVTTSRSVEPEDWPEAPPTRVWDRVADELNLGATTVDVPLVLPVAARRTPSWRALVAACVAAALIGAGNPRHRRGRFGR